MQLAARRPALFNFRNPSVPASMVHGLLHAVPSRDPDAELVARRAAGPREADDAKDTVEEIKEGEGGEDSALLAGDLLQMHLRYAERRG